MSKLRHIAIAVADTDATAKFYEQAFGLTRVRQSANAVMLTDGVISLAILDNKVSHEAMGEHGLHHIGFIADDVPAAGDQAEAHGAQYADTEENAAVRYAQRGQMKDGQLTAEARRQEQHKYVDPNGIKFDIVNPLHARNSWRVEI